MEQRKKEERKGEGRESRGNETSTMHEMKRKERRSQMPRECPWKRETMQKESETMSCVLLWRQNVDPRWRSKMRVQMRGRGMWEMREREKRVPREPKEKEQRVYMPHPELQRNEKEKKKTMREKWKENANLLWKPIYIYYEKTRNLLRER